MPSRGYGETHRLRAVNVWGLYTGGVIGAGWGPIQRGGAGHRQGAGDGPDRRVTGDFGGGVKWR